MNVECYHKSMSKPREMAVHIVRQHEQTNDLQYWLSKPESERISAIEFLREQYYVLSGNTTIPRLVHILQKRKLHRT